MFEKGQAVKCIDSRMEGMGPCLTQVAQRTKEQIYHIEEFVPPEECRRLWPGNIYGWEKEGGRVELKEEPGCHFFGRRFQAIN